MLQAQNNGERFELFSPTAMPRAAGFLWNRHMMIQVNCRGFTVAQFMQPEPAKYTYAPNLEAKTFMQPEQPYYAHHPGRFCYIKDEETGEIFSAPYEPVRKQLDHFNFSVGKSDIRWTVEHLGIRVEMELSLPTDAVVELWQIKVSNISGKPRKLSVYPYTPVGYMSWMNQSAAYREDLGGVVASCVTPYQKVADYFKNKYFKDKTFFLHDRAPDAFECAREAFEGEGGLHNPDGLQQETLNNGDALYETPAAVLQYRVQLAAGQSESYRFLLGPAFDDAEIISVRDRFFADADFAATKAQYAAYIEAGKGVLQIETPDQHLDQFVNHWLPRQVYYHGDVNRLTTDPQTRNYLQDNMGMTFIKPEVARAAFLHALSQQEHNGAIPDGILLVEGAELKYINQIPHTDHCVWLPVCLRAYLDETNDYAIFDEPVKAWQGEETKTAFERISNAMRWLLSARDERGLSYIAQGDWCDPMNMVGYKGKGVSGWLSVATAYALNLWADICEHLQQADLAAEFRAGARDVNKAVNTHMWDGEWYGRGITDDGVIFGVSKDKEGRIFLNPQSWAILAGTADATKRAAMIKAIEQQLETPYGVMMLAPAYTKMREDVGRVTQKFPGSAENGSVYNHAAVFYIYSLYTIQETDRAYRLVRQMLSGPDEADYLQRGQMPVYIPNYYRGAYYQFPRTAGRSSQLFNTGTVSWVYRSLIEGLFGLKGNSSGLLVQPQLPSAWQTAKATRQFRGATFEVSYSRAAGLDGPRIVVDGQTLAGNCIANIQAGKTYKVEVTLPV
ncbi:GH36-type glycosyl hydrolase domain-containing protein [Saccharophagus sp. K07]|uniref:GH36-type glycosyl hydrolase domain-containing protein n=1 Tax=Saccharophagus sp. K07 TaxID=2283636 RepID=UPI001CA36618|nr:NdvB protein [Saccharophagus sp. K07]